jgi:hypothetical protein
MYITRALIGRNPCLDLAIQTRKFKDHVKSVLRIRSAHACIPMVGTIEIINNTRGGIEVKNWERS